MDNGKKYTKMDKRWTLTWTVCIIFAVLIVLVCLIDFLYKYDIAYNGNTNGGFLPRNFELLFDHLQIGFLALIVAIILKLLLRKRIRLVPLLLVAFCLPAICHTTNKYLFMRDGLLYPMVCDGGVLNFLVINDLNLDGINDEEYRLKHEERAYGQLSGSSSDNKVLKNVQLRAYGKGEGLEHIFGSDGSIWKEQMWQVHLDIFGDRELSLTRLELTFNFWNKSDGERARLYIVDKEGEIICELSCEVLSDGGVKTVIDNSNVEGLSEKREIYVKYVLE